MGILEVILLLAGAVLAVLSFVLPTAKEEASRETKVLAKEEIKTMVDTEMNSIRQHVDDVVDEAVGYAVEKTERSLERLTNEKIMAVNEYSDTVLQEIHKNHEEAMFLYDMLNAKHDTLKDTVSEAGKAVQEARDVMEKMAPLQESIVAAENEAKETKVPARGESAVSESKTPEVKIPEFERLDRSSIAKVSGQGAEKTTGKKTASKKTAGKKNEEAVLLEEPIKEWDFLTDVKEDETHGTNNNEQILNLHKQGKSTVAIAKELGLGVGEVKLVIDLYKNS